MVSQVWHKCSLPDSLPRLCGFSKCSAPTFLSWHSLYTPYIYTFTHTSLTHSLTDGLILGQGHWHMTLGGGNPTTNPTFGRRLLFPWAAAAPVQLWSSPRPTWASLAADDQSGSRGTVSSHEIQREALIKTELTNELLLVKPHPCSDSETGPLRSSNVEEHLDPFLSLKQRKPKVPEKSLIRGYSNIPKYIYFLRLT